jgi:hypothetical protein
MNNIFSLVDVVCDFWCYNFNNLYKLCEFPICMEVMGGLMTSYFGMAQCGGFSLVIFGVVESLEFEDENVFNFVCRVRNSFWVWVEGPRHRCKII